MRGMTVVLVGALGFALAGACGSDDSPAPAAAGGAAVATGAGGTKGSAGTGAGGTTVDSSVPAGCERFGFVASGKSCGASCTSFSCSCPGAFPKSVASCTVDGCLIAGDCARICAEDLGNALSCTKTYTVAPPPDAGTPDGKGGAAGSSGTVDAAKPMCSPSDVHLPAESAVVLGTAPLTNANLLTDDTGALYIAASVAAASAVDLGGGALPSGKSIVLFKLDANHQHVWSKRIG